MGGSIVEDRGRTGVRHAGSSCPTGGCGELPRLPWPAAHSGAFAPAGARKWVGIAAEIIPKASSNAGQSLSQPAAASSLYTREPLGRGCGLPRRPCGPPRNDNRFLPFRGAERRGNPFLSNRDRRGSALSAERGAGQIRGLPDDLFVQHGAEGPEVSARPRPCSRRGCSD